MDLKNIGNMLAGYSAGSTGQLPAFVQNQQRQQMMDQEQQQRQQISAEERMNTYFTDAAIGLDLINQGNIDGFLQLGAQRLQLLQNFPDADPSDTQILMQLGAAAKNGSREALEHLKGELQTAVTIGKGRGVIQEVKPESFTLSPGQQRFSGSELVAQVPAAAGTGFSLSPGQTRFDASGNPVANLPDRPESAPNMREREARIQEYMGNFGVDRPTAISRLDAQYMTDPVTGNLIAVDRTTGGATIPRVDTGAAPAQIPAPPPISIDQLSFDPGTGTGLGASLLGVWNSTAGQLPFLPTFMGPETAAQQLTILERDAIKALASSSRPPVVEQNRILAAVPKAMEFGENPNVARSKMVSFVDLMTNQYVDDLRYSKDLSQPKTLREESGRRAREIEGIFGRVLTPDASRMLRDSIAESEQAVGRINELPFDRILEIDPRNLSDFEFDIYQQRLNSGR
jgi:hypothetical protein